MNAQTSVPKAIHKPPFIPASGTLLHRNTLNNPKSRKAVPPEVHEVVTSPGLPLEGNIRNFMEQRFGHNFSNIRIHNDDRAADSARSISALAYTVGNHIVYGSSTKQYSFSSYNGQKLLAHELAHTIQQGGAGLTDTRELEIGNENSVHEQEANASANNIYDKRQKAHVNTRAGGVIMRLTPGEFRTQLGATEDQKKSIDALFSDKTFLSLWDYMKNCPVKPKKDLGPLGLKVTPGLKIGGDVK